MTAGPLNFFPEAGDIVSMVRAGTQIRIESRTKEGGQGVVFRGSVGERQMAVKWYRPNPFEQRQRNKIAVLASRNRPHPAFAWPIDIVECVRARGFGYVMPWVPERFSSLIELLANQTQPSFRIITALARELVDALGSLHSAGWTYGDINFGNLLVDPDRCEVAIVDNDNICPEGGDAIVKGTLRFMAPEIICGTASPSIVTDLHSLAVFLHFMLVHGHPLEGSRVRTSYTWQTEGHVSDTDLAIRFLGKDPLFVFDPNDRSNTPEPGDLMLTWWPIYPRFLQELFVRAFTVGLKDPSIGGRVAQGEWRKALLRLSDCIELCSCRAEVFWDPDDAAKECWNCGEVVPRPPLLKLPGHVVALAEGTVLTGNHLIRNLDYKSRMGLVERHPRDPTGLVLRNLSDQTWTLSLPDEPIKTVEPGKRLGIRPMSISFGDVKGVITMDGTPT